MDKNIVVSIPDFDLPLCRSSVEAFLSNWREDWPANVVISSIEEINACTVQDKLNGLFENGRRLPATEEQVERLLEIRAKYIIDVVATDSVLELGTTSE